MPQAGADGDVIDIALHTVKEQNWDKTVTTIPTHRLISDSYKNWRAMFEAGGRKVQRSLRIDQTSIRFLEPDEVTRLKRFSLLADYLGAKESDIAAWNAARPERARDAVNARRITNIRSEEHTSELQSLMRTSYAVFCLKKKRNITTRMQALRYCVRYGSCA